MHPAALDLLLKLRHPKQGLTGEMRQFTIDEEEVTLPIAKVSGLQMAFPDPDEEDPAFRESIFDSFDVIDFGEGDDATRLLPSGKVIVTDDRMVNYKEGRGGRFAEWLVEHLVKEKTDGNRQLAWQASPPPLYQEGIKIQTPWLYDFLLEPQTIRHTTVLRMPKFNMSNCLLYTSDAADE
mgnify:CR=1 FL=1